MFQQIRNKIYSELQWIWRYQVEEIWATSQSHPPFCQNAEPATWDTSRKRPYWASPRRRRLSWSPWSQSVKLPARRYFDFPHPLSSPSTEKKQTRTSNGDSSDHKLDKKGTYNFGDSLQDGWKSRLVPFILWWEITERKQQKVQKGPMEKGLCR